MRKVDVRRAVGGEADTSRLPGNDSGNDSEIKEELPQASTCKVTKRNTIPKCNTE